jgi:predicted esterase
MKKIVVSILLGGLLAFHVNAQTNNQSPACVNYIPGFSVTINGIYQNGVGPQNVTFGWNPLWNFPNALRQKRVSNLNIGGTDLFHGLLEYLPSSYSLAANATKKYPVIIFFHGASSVGDGSALQLCRLFKDVAGDLVNHLAIPGRVERNPELFTQTIGGETLEFIVISPQYSVYKRLEANPANNRYPTAGDVEDVIDYVEQTYRIDPRRIYLTGYSSGANMIAEYAASSVARAKRIAALMPVALCSDLSHPQNASYDPKRIGQAKLKTWFVQCEGELCKNYPPVWYNQIKSVANHEPPRITTLRYNTDPPTLYNCSDTILHDAWSRAYDPNFKLSFVNGTGATDTYQGNMYQWISTAQSAVLPVVLQSYNARLINNKVEINWTTSDEKDNKSFMIERAGADQVFINIGTVAGAGNNTGLKNYSFTDYSPLNDLSHYRLVQVDIDGQKTYFDIKKIINRGNKENAVIVSPNPFSSELSAFISLNRSQKVFISLTTLSGSIVKNTSGVYGQGSAEIKINSTELSTGIYLLKVSGEDFSITQKVVKK